MDGFQSEGPEQLTLFERLVRRLRIPYWLACLLLAIVPGYASSNFGESVLSWLLWTLLAFYMFYIIRYMRTKVVEAESEIIPLCPRGEETFHKAFSHLPKVESPTCPLAYDRPHQHLLLLQTISILIISLHNSYSCEYLILRGGLGYRLLGLHEFNLRTAFSWETTPQPESLQ